MKPEHLTYEYSKGQNAHTFHVKIGDVDRTVGWKGTLTPEALQFAIERLNVVVGEGIDRL